MKKATVIGSGSWGTALAVLLANNGLNVNMWCWDESRAEKIIAAGENTEYLPGAKLPKSLQVTTDIATSVSEADIIVSALDSTHLKSTLTAFAPHITKNQIIVNGTKGIEDASLKTFSQVIAEILPGCPVAVLSGPTHAEEVSTRIPTACVISSGQRAVAEAMQAVFTSDVFRVYTNPDVIGVELGGALKNVITLAAGVCDGLGFGDNTKAALITRGIAEIARLGVAMGANHNTFAGLSGIGDLIVTCTSMHSRNRRAGILLGKGKTADEVQAEVHMVVEGIHTAAAAYKLAQKYNIEMPITKEVNAILFEGKTPRTALADLMTRDKTTEPLIGCENWL